MYWDYNTEDSANDVTAIVSDILESRRADSLACRKVSLLAVSLGSQESSIVLSKYPADSTQRVSQLVNLVPCYVPNLD